MNRTNTILVALLAATGACSDDEFPIECGAIGSHLIDQRSFPPSFDAISEAPFTASSVGELGEFDSVNTFVPGSGFELLEGFLSSGGSVETTYRTIRRDTGGEVTGSAYAVFDWALLSGEDVRVPATDTRVTRADGNVQIDFRFVFDDSSPTRQGFNQVWVVLVGGEGREFGPGVFDVSVGFTLFKDMIAEPDIELIDEGQNGRSLDTFRLVERSENSFELDFTAESFLESDACPPEFVENHALLAFESGVPVLLESGSFLSVVQVPAGTTRNLDFGFQVSRSRPRNIQVVEIEGLHQPGQRLACREDGCRFEFSEFNTWNNFVGILFEP